MKFIQSSFRKSDSASCRYASLVVAVCFHCAGCRSHSGKNAHGGRGGRLCYRKMLTSTAGILVYRHLERVALEMLSACVIYVIIDKVGR